MNYQCRYTFPTIIAWGEVTPYWDFVNWELRTCYDPSSKQFQFLSPGVFSPVWFSPPKCFLSQRDFLSQRENRSFQCTPCASDFNRKCAQYTSEMTKYHFDIYISSPSTNSLYQESESLRERLGHVLLFHRSHTASSTLLHPVTIRYMILFWWFSRCKQFPHSSPNVVEYSFAFRS